MLPIVGVPETIRQGMAPYRDVFCRDAGFEHVSRYVTGVVLSPNKTSKAFTTCKCGVESSSVRGAPCTKRSLRKAGPEMN